jgi:hypothetical protein
MRPVQELLTAKFAKEGRKVREIEIEARPKRPLRNLAGFPFPGHAPKDIPIEQLTDRTRQTAPPPSSLPMRC